MMLIHLFIYLHNCRIEIRRLGTIDTPDYEYLLPIIIWRNPISRLTSELPI